MPIINKLNPANMITDGFYSLYYYDTLDRYYSNIASLLIFSGLMLVISILALRKQKYESIQGGKRMVIYKTFLKVLNKYLLPPTTA